jgi:hypothetical protein
MVLSELICYVVSYDTIDQKRLQKVHKAMMDFAEPLHYSVFRCGLTLKGRMQMCELSQPGKTWDPSESSTSTL